MHKRRLAFDRTVTTHVVGDIADRIPIVIDDIIAGGSVLDQLEALVEAGARPEVHLVITHGILTPSALARLDRPLIKEILITDTVPLTPERAHPKIKVCSIAPMLAEVIDRIHRCSSLSSG
jgi:ribose-phosphate pyrophosphokinase